MKAIILLSILPTLVQVVNLYLNPRRILYAHALDHSIQPNRGTTIEIPALGRSALIGELYDAKVDDFVKTSVFNSSFPPITTTQNFTHVTQLHRRETLTRTVSNTRDKIRLLHMNPVNVLGIKSGATRSGGSSLYFKDENVGRTSSNFVEGLMALRVRTSREQIDLISDSIKNLMSTQILQNTAATHMVIGIEYGVDTFVQVLDKSGFTGGYDRGVNDMTQNLQVLGHHLHRVVYRSPDEAVDYSVRQLAGDYEYRIFSDVPHGQLFSTSFSQILEMIDTYPSILGRPLSADWSVPKSFILYPLAMLRKLWDTTGSRPKPSKSANWQTVDKTMEMVSHLILNTFDLILTSQQELNDVLALIQKNRVAIQDEHVAVISKQKINLDKSFLQFQDNLRHALWTTRQNIEVNGLGQDLSTPLNEVNKNCFINVPSVKNNNSNLLTKQTIQLIEKKVRQHNLFQSLETQGRVTYLTRDSNFNSIFADSDEDPDHPETLVYVLHFKSEWVGNDTASLSPPSDLTLGQEWTLNFNFLLNSLNGETQPGRKLVILDCDFSVDGSECGRVQRPAIYQYKQGAITSTNYVETHRTVAQAEKTRLQLVEEKFDNFHIATQNSFANIQGRLDNHAGLIQQNGIQITRNVEAIQRTDVKIQGMVQSNAIERRRVANYSQLILTHQSKIRENTESIEGTKEKVDQNSKLLAKMESDIEQHGKSIQGATEKFSQMTTALDKIGEKIRTHGEKMAENRVKIDDNFVSLERLNARIDRGGVQIQELRNKTRDNSKLIASNSVQINNNSMSFLATSNLVESHLQLIRECQMSTKDNFELIQQNRMNITSNSRAIHRNEGNILNNLNKIQINGGKIKDNVKSLNNHQADLDNHFKSIHANSESIQRQRQSIDNFQGQLDDLSSSVDRNGVKIKENMESITGIKSKFLTFEEKIKTQAKKLDKNSESIQEIKIKLSDTLKSLTSAKIQMDTFGASLQNQGKKIDSNLQLIGESQVNFSQHLELIEQNNILINELSKSLLENQIKCENNSKAIKSQQIQINGNVESITKNQIEINKNKKLMTETQYEIKLNGKSAIDNLKRIDNNSLQIQDNILTSENNLRIIKQIEDKLLNYSNTLRDVQLNVNGSLSLIKESQLKIGEHSKLFQCQNQTIDNISKSIVQNQLNIQKHTAAIVAIEDETQVNLKVREEMEIQLRRLFELNEQSNFKIEINSRAHDSIRRILNQEISSFSHTLREKLNLMEISLLDHQNGLVRLELHVETQFSNQAESMGMIKDDVELKYSHLNSTLTNKLHHLSFHFENKTIQLNSDMTQELNRLADLIQNQNVERLNLIREFWGLEFRMEDKFKDTNSSCRRFNGMTREELGHNFTRLWNSTQEQVTSLKRGQVDLMERMSSQSHDLSTHVNKSEDKLTLLSDNLSRHMTHMETEQWKSYAGLQEMSSDYSDSLMNQPKARLYSSSHDLRGNHEDYNHRMILTQSRCQNLVRLGGQVSYVDTFGTCIRVFEFNNCHGRSWSLYPGSEVTRNIVGMVNGSPLAFIHSVGPCAPQEFQDAYQKSIHPSPQSNLQFKPHFIPLKLKDPPRNKFPIPNFLIVPNNPGRGSTFQRCSPLLDTPITHFSQGPLNGTEFLAGRILPGHFKNDTFDKSHAVLGYIIPPHFSGPVNLSMNKFPQSEWNRENWAIVLERIQQFLMVTNRAYNNWVDFALTLEYPEENGVALKPSGFTYRLNYGDHGIEYGHLSNQKRLES